MSDDKLSQNDIDALIAKVRGTSATTQPSNSGDDFEKLGLNEIDKKGLSKLFRISIEASSEVLESITQREITIDSISDIKLAGGKEISKLIEPPFIATKVDYTIGLRGLDLLLIKQQDMNNLMSLQFESMGFEPSPDDEEFILSASNEVMNQMLGHTANKLGNALDIFIDISTPTSTVINDEVHIPELKEDSSSYIYTTFKLNIGGRVTGDLIKILDSDFIEELKDIMHKGTYLDEWKTEETATEEEEHSFNHNLDTTEDDETEHSFNHNIDTTEDNSVNNQPMYHEEFTPRMQQPYQKPSNIVDGTDLAVSKYELPRLESNPNFDPRLASTSRIKSVEVELTVELGRTKMKVKDILELDKGSIIELQRLAGEHVDLYANGTLISKGEVVVIKDNFAFRVLNIVDQDYR